MDYPASTLVHPSSKTCSTPRATTQATHHSPRRVVAIPNACCLILGPLGTVRRPYRHVMIIVDDHCCSLSAIIVNSIVLLTNGISFAIQAVLLLTIGGWADYGTWRYARTWH